MLEVLGSIGVKYEWQGTRSLLLDTTGPLQLEHIDRTASKATRVVLLLIGALAAREQRYRLYKSGGCHLGKRTIRPHVFALEKMGIQITSRAEYYEIDTRQLTSARIVMYESSDTATANAILAAVRASGVTTLTFASANYMVQDLCYFLVAAGAKIEGIGTTTLTVTGVKQLREVRGYDVMPDPLDAMTGIALAATAHAPLTIVGCPLDFLELELEKLSVMGQKFEIEHERLSKNKQFRLGDIRMIPSRLTALPDKIYGRPYPGLNIDNLPLFYPIVTQAKGRTLVHDWVYENRALYALEFQKLGAQIMLLDPHRVLVDGKTPLIGNDIICPPAIRPAMALLIGMCAAKGKSILHRVNPIERAYEDLVPRLQAVGVDIVRS